MESHVQEAVDLSRAYSRSSGSWKSTMTIDIQRLKARLEQLRKRDLLKIKIEIIHATF